MWKDPIVEEIRAVREQIAREFNYDLGEIMAHLRKSQEANLGRVVSKEDVAKRKRTLGEPNRDRKDAA